MATVSGLVLSVVIELLQHIWRPERAASMQDVVANTIGGLLGATAGLGGARPASSLT